MALLLSSSSYPEKRLLIFVGRARRRARRMSETRSAGVRGAAVPKSGKRLRNVMRAAEAQVVHAGGGAQDVGGAAKQAPISGRTARQRSSVSDSCPVGSPLVPSVNRHREKKRSLAVDSGLMGIFRASARAIASETTDRAAWRRRRIIWWEQSETSRRSPIRPRFVRASFKV